MFHLVTAAALAYEIRHQDTHRSTLENSTTIEPGAVIKPFDIVHWAAERMAIGSESHDARCDTHGCPFVDEWESLRCGLDQQGNIAVSYTHLTLPTNREV